MSECLFDNLPVELIHRILDNLDVVTTFRSFRHACKRFYTIVNAYNRYAVNLSEISKNDFHSICQIIRPKNILSLTLSDNDTTANQIRLFLSLFNINQFTQLRSLTLIEIDLPQLNKLIKYIKINSLQTLSIRIRRKDSKVDQNLSITSILTNLQKLELTTWHNEINNFVWPKQCHLKHLTIGRYITSKQICRILSELTSLESLVLQNAIVNDINEINSIISETKQNTSLTSLIFTNSQLQMIELEYLLLFTPNLVHLRLISSAHSSDDILNGSKWENFIQTQLISLKTFEFFFRSQIIEDQSLTDVESRLRPFRTSFWVDYKSWFITCDFIPKTKTLRLYTIPICDTPITYESDFDKITSTTCATIDNSNVKMNHVRELELDLTLLSSNLMKQAIELRRNYLFKNLNELTLVINEDWSFNSVEYLSSLIDLSKVNALTFHIEFESGSVINTINNINDLLQRSTNVHSLALTNSSESHILKKIAIDLSSRLPEHIKHLNISGMTLTDMKQILINAKHVSSIAFELSYDLSFNAMKIVRWLEQRRYFTYLLERSSLSLWLGNMIDISENSELSSITFTKLY